MLQPVDDLKQSNMSTTSVTWISKNLSLPVEIYFDSLIEDRNFESRQVHNSYEYSQDVENRRLWPQINIFYDYLIKKEVNNLLQQEAADRRAQAGVNRLHRIITRELFARGTVQYVVTYDEEKGVETAYYAIDNSHDEILTEKFYYLRLLVQSYMIYKNFANPTREIVQYIFNTAMLHSMHFRDNNSLPIKFSKSLINEANVEETLKYVKSLDLSDVILNPVADCQFFQGDGDLLLHDCLLEINLSKYYFRSNNLKTDYQLMTTIYQMILYGFGLFLRERRVIKKFVIYNPLLGVEYILDIPLLDYNYLLRMVQMKGISDENLASS